MTKVCVVCGASFETVRAKVVTCGVRGGPCWRVVRRASANRAMQRWLTSPLGDQYRAWLKTEGRPASYAAHREWWRRTRDTRLRVHVVWKLRRKFRGAPVPAAVEAMVVEAWEANRGNSLRFQ